MAMPLFRAALVLGLLSAVGPFAIDMYLPAMPVLTADLNGTVAEAQFTLTAYFLAFGISQLFYGPWSDQVGRKRPLYLGLSIFVLGSIGCALAPSLTALAGFRALQGLGAAVVMVIPRAIIRDLHTGTAATRLMAMVMLVISVSPFLAPLAGSGMIALAGWRVIFWILCAAAAFSLVMTGTLLPETLEPEHRVPVHVRSLMRSARMLLRDPTFMGLTFIGGFGMASFFVFIASASFVYSGQFGLSPVGFSLAFAINALGFFGSSQIAAPLGERFGMLPVMGWAVSGFAAVTVSLAIVTALGFAGLPLIVAGLFVGNACLGLVIPTTMVMALDEHGDVAGLASSLGGTLQMLAGGAMIALGGLFFDGTALPMVTAIAICAVVALTLAGLTLPRLARAAA
ncbi:MAG: Bcr/CflA family efflux MFS transporter [Limimaricola sp.]|uniref:multidrug effflux MFS transporter n=1 Tax=Limimaricola sp. TaxID=2211665 RepID=UPI001D95E0CD|nr:multidrug effflux MFS transporter [Limimaricola sp.]MBI1416630.1 Bcr/CflA family efflux MFS transporter [Limimaricola sp.]